MPLTPQMAAERRLQGEMRKWGLPGLVLALVVVALSELLVAGWPPAEGLRLNARLALACVFEVLAILMLIAFGVGSRQRHGALGEYFLALTLVPALRLVSLSLPSGIFGIGFHARLFLVSVPLFVGLLVLANSRHLVPWQIGLGWPRLGSAGGVLWTLVAIPAILGGAFAEYRLLDPDLPEVHGPTLVFVVFVLVAIALWQELVFRGVLVQLGRAALGGQTAVLLSALFFAAMQLGTQSAYSWEGLAVVGVALLVGWTAAQAARATRSAVLTTLAYAGALVLYFVVFPRSL